MVLKSDGGSGHGTPKIWQFGILNALRWRSVRKQEREGHSDPAPLLLPWKGSESAPGGDALSLTCGKECPYRSVLRSGKDMPAWRRTRARVSLRFPRWLHFPPPPPWRPTLHRTSNLAEKRSGLINCFFRSSLLYAGSHVCKTIYYINVCAFSPVNLSLSV